LVIYGKRQLHVQTTADLYLLPLENQEKKKKGISDHVQKVTFLLLTCSEQNT